MSKPAANRRSASRPPSAPEVPSKNRARHAALIQTASVFAVALIARGLHFAAMRDSLFFDVLVCDGRQYDAWARRIAGGQWLGTEIFYQTPLYPYFLATVYTFAGHSVWAVRVVQAIAGAMACAFATRAGTAYFSPRIGWIAGLMLAIYPPAIFFDGIIQKASLDLLFMTALLWVTGAAQRESRNRYFLLAGLLLGAMTLNRENAVVLVPLLAGWVLWFARQESWVVKSRRVGLLALGLSAVLLPVGLRNYYVGGQFLLTTSQLGPNFYIGNRAGASGLYEPLRPGRGDPIFESQDAKLLAERALERPLSPGEVSDYWLARSWHDIQADFGGWLMLLARKWVFTWNALELVDAEGIRVHERESWLLGLVGHVWHFGVVCPFAAAGIWLSRRDWRMLWLLYAILLVFAVAVTLFFVFARYRYPLVPVLMLFAAAAVVWGYDYWRSRIGSPRDLAAAAILAGLVAIGCNWPFPRLINDEVSYITAANGLLDDLRPAEALQLLQAAEKIDPRSDVIYTNLGVAALKLDRFDDAQRYFQHATELAPKIPLAYQGLGEVYLRRGDRAAAEQQWRKAIALDPLFGQAYRSLGSSELASGNTQRAIELLRRSLELEPASVAARVDLAMALIAQGRIPEARKELEAASNRTPQLREANNLAWILATAPDASLRNASEALRLARYACEATEHKQPDLLDTLAAAYANGGDFAAASRWAGEAIKLAAAERNESLAGQLKERKALYDTRKPFRDPQLAVPAASGQP